MEVSIVAAGFTQKIYVVYGIVMARRR